MADNVVRRSPIRRRPSPRHREPARDIPPLLTLVTERRSPPRNISRRSAEELGPPDDRRRVETRRERDEPVRRRRLSEESRPRRPPSPMRPFRDDRVSPKSVRISPARDDGGRACRSRRDRDSVDRDVLRARRDDPAGGRHSPPVRRPRPHRAASSDGDVRGGRNRPFEREADRDGERARNLRVDDGDFVKQFEDVDRRLQQNEAEYQRLRSELEKTMRVGSRRSADATRDLEDSRRRNTTKTSTPRRR